MEEAEVKTYPQWIKDLVIKVWSEDIEPRNWSSFNSSAKYSENKRNTIMFAMGRVAEEAVQKERAEVRRDALLEERANWLPLLQALGDLSKYENLKKLPLDWDDGSHKNWDRARKNVYIQTQKIKEILAADQPGPD
jgi:hypothetical protein